MKHRFLIGCLLLVGCSKDPSRPFLALGASTPTLQHFDGTPLKIRIEGQSNAVRMTPNGIISLQNSLKKELVVLNCAIGGSYLREHMPGTAIFNGCETYMPDPDVIIFYQGESDTKDDGDYMDWAQKFTDLLTMYRHLHGSIPIVFCQIATRNTNDPNLSTFIHWQEVQDQQSQIYANRVKMVKTGDLSLEDGIHLTQASQVMLGVRIAEVLNQINAGE